MFFFVCLALPFKHVVFLLRNDEVILSKKKTWLLDKILGTVVFSDGGATQVPPASPKRESLESRHQELLKTQRQLQERFDRLQKIHGPQLMPTAAALGTVPSGSESAATSQAIEESAQTTETCSGLTPNLHFNEVKSQEAKQGSSKLVEQSSSSLETDDMSVSSTTSSMMTEIECDTKGKDFRFISLLLDATHETDIL